MPAKKKPRKDDSWGVEGYDSPERGGCHYTREQTLSQGDKYYEGRMKYYRCFGPDCQAYLDNLLDNMPADELHWSSVYRIQPGGWGGAGLQKAAIHILEQKLQMY